MAESKVRIKFEAQDATKPAVRSAADGVKELQTRIKELQQIQKDAAKAKLAAPNMASYKEASADLKAVTKDLKMAQDELRESTKVLGDDLNGGALSAKNLFTSFTAASLAADLIRNGIQSVKQNIQDSITVAEQYNMTMAGLSSAANAFGQNATQVREAAKSASSDGLVPLTSNAAALRDLLQSGLDLDQATALLSRMKDEAAFGRANTIEYGQAVENLAQAFKTEQSMLGNLSGHADNFSKALEIGAASMGKNVSALTEAERLQAKYIGYLQQGAYAQGDAARYAATSAGEQARLNYQQQEAQRILGTALLPAVTMMRQGFIQLLTGGIVPTEESTKQLQGNFLALATSARVAMVGITGLGKGLAGVVEYIAMGSTTMLQSAINDTRDGMISAFQDMDDGFRRIAEGADMAAEGQTNLANTAATETSKAMQKMQRDIDEANKQFLRSQAQRLKDFKEALEDMIIAHRDKTTSIQADIAEETNAYKQAALEREAALNKDLAKLEEQHGKKVSDITKKISEERERGIIVDGVRYANANQEKITELEVELSEERAAYQSSIDERKAQYAADVANDKAKHDAKIAQLTTTLNEEKAILARHAADVKAVGDKQKEDDITRLKRKFAEEKALAELQHQESVARIRQQGNEQGAAYTSGFGAGVQSRSASVAKQTEAAFRDVMKGVERGLASGGLTMGSGNSSSSGGNAGQSIARALLSLVPGMGSVASAMNLLPFAEGGTINRPTLLVDKATGRPFGEMAERGPEDIVPRGSVRQGLNSGGMTVNIKEQHFHSNLDQTSFLRQMYWEGRR